jgi:endonuclease/exonuclease/phosphatase family metal-dependent hydrolase
MRPFGKPDFEHAVDISGELDRLRQHQAHRQIPAATSSNLIVATWNLTNFGMQEREDEHLRIMAEILRPFDVIAVQELADDLDHLEALLSILGDTWDAIYSDVGGNQERLGYLFNNDRIIPTRLAAELAMRAYERQRIVIEDITEEFEGFNRNPYLRSFSAGEFDFTLVNVHLYWTSFALRRLEAKALSRWAKSRVPKPYPPNDDIVLLGDFNMPKVEEGDEIHDILVENGLVIPKFNTELIGSNLAGDKHYDEIAFFPSRTNEDFTDRIGVFDFDKVIFPDLWDDEDKAAQKRFYQFVRYYLADHRPLWIEFHRTGDGT